MRKEKFLLRSDMIRSVRRGVSVILIASIVCGIAPRCGMISSAAPAMKVVSETSTETTDFINALKAGYQYAINTETFVSNYNTAEDSYKKATTTLINDAISADAGSVSTVDVFGKLDDLIGLAYTVINNISAAESIRTSSAGITESTYSNFSVAMNNISNSSSTGSLDRYLSKYDELKTNSALTTCLPDNDTAKYYLINNTKYVVSTSTVGSENKTAYKITNNTAAAKYYDSIYKNLLNIYTVEEAYINLRSTIGSDVQLKTSGFNSDVRSAIAAFSSTVSDHGGTSTVSALNKYNGADITELLKKYNHITTYLTALDAVVEYPKTESQMKAAIYAYTLYNGLTDDEKAMITSDDVTKMNTYCLQNTKVNDIITMIDAITWPTSAETYKTFDTAYTSALNAYNALIKQYGTSSGVENLITNREKLVGDMTSVKSIIDRIVTIVNTKTNEPSSMCGLYTVDMTKINNDYQALSSANKTHVYNWADFSKIYQDTKAAYDLRARIDRLEIALTAEDETEVKSIRTAYSNLNDDAKKYFGNTYVDKISILEYSIYALTKNNAAYVVDLINKIGTVTANSGTKIVAAENAYAQLASSEKSLVSNYSTLVAARAKYNELRADLGAASVTGVKTGYVFTGSKIKPVPVVKIDGQVLVKGVDYTLSYSSNKNVGTGYVTITAIDGSGFKGSYKKSFKIVKDSIKGCGISGLKNSYKYTGKAIKPTFKVKVNGIYIKKGTSYTVTYKNNKKKGTATITLKGKGNYKGTRKVTFKIK